MSQFRGSAYILAAFVAVAFAISLMWNPPPSPKFVGIAAREVPDQMGTFAKLEDRELDEQTRDTLKSASLFSRLYGDANASHPPIDLTIIGGTDRDALHDPRSCLVGSGWELANDRLVPLPGTNVIAHMCVAESKAENQKNAMMYLYVVDGHIVNQVRDIRFEMGISALLGKKNRPVFFVRCMQQIPMDAKDDKEAEAQLAAFSAEVWKSMGDRFSGKAQQTAKN